MALSFRRTAIAESFLCHVSDGLLSTEVGVLPMRLEIDHWMSVLRMLICGERYIPYELFNAVPLPESVVKSEAPQKKPRPLSLRAVLQSCLRGVSV